MMEFCLGPQHNWNRPNVTAQDHFDNKNKEGSKLSYKQKQTSTTTLMPNL